tara:strand:+ start:2804 stop:4033 length:1230 start_codon:yes stop_codon:yes gene_type:complete
MAEKITAKVLETEEKSLQQKEKEVQENAGVKFEDGVYKVDLTKTNKENAVQEQSTDDSNVVVEQPEDSSNSQEVAEEVRDTEEKEEIEQPIVEEITDETDTTNETGVAGSVENANAAPEQEEILQEDKTQEQIKLPENVSSLVEFMNETGGSIEDYVRLSADYSNADQKTLLREYYKQTKPHLNDDEVSFLMESDFSWDEENDEPRDIKKKQIALKEEVAKAKNFLTGLKDQYYKEVKLGSKLLPEQQKAIEFFNRYSKEQQSNEELLSKQAKHFDKETEKVFNTEFKGFNFKVGDKKFRFNVKDVSKVKENQADLLNVFNKYVNNDNLLQDAAGYHKALFAANNADEIANHFYQQGKADAIKETMANAKNISMDPRKSAEGYVNAGGIKVRAVSGDNNSGLKLKLKNY